MLPELFDGEILQPHVLEDDPHLLVDPLYLLQTKLVYLPGGHVGGGVEPQHLVVEPVPARQTAAPDLWPGVWNVFLRQEFLQPFERVEN